MTDLKQTQQTYRNLREQAASASTKLQMATAAKLNLDAQARQSDALDANSRQQKLAEIAAQQLQIQEQINQFTNDKNSFTAQLNAISAQFLADIDPTEKIVQLDDHFPILLFPLRLETRFKKSGNQSQLWLRVYPDECNINKKEELLSITELKNAYTFWINIWKAGQIEKDERAAWRSLVNSHGSGRAEWIIRQFKPGNIKPQKPDATWQIFVLPTPIALSNAARVATTAYWAAIWLAQGNTQQIQVATQTLQLAINDSVLTEQIIQNIPANLSDPVPANASAAKVMLADIELPDPENYVTTQTSWNQAPKAIGLPDRFVVVAMEGNNKKTALFEKHVQENLSVGADPSLSGNEQIRKDADKDLVINEELAWMVDFEKALAAGMATKIDLTPAEAETGFERLFVTGIRFTSDPADGQAMLEKLITDRYHSKDGFSLIKQGTPTNNTEEEAAGYSWSDDADASFDRVFKQTESFTEEPELALQADGQILANALGISPDILKVVPNAKGTDQQEAKAMNTALFPATLGYFMEEMMDPLFGDNDLNDTKNFFSGHVSGRGPIPAVRFGKQPYGILPVTVHQRLFTDLKGVTGTNDATGRKLPFIVRLHQLLMKMDATWQLQMQKVPYIGKSGDPHQILMDVIALQANSVEFHQRYAQSITQLYNQLNMQRGADFAALQALYMVQRAKEILNVLAPNLKDSTLPILEKFFLSQPNLLSGPLVDDVPNSETNPVRSYTSDGKNYLSWLLNSSAEKVRTLDFGTETAPNALLFLLLRHALVLSQSQTATRFHLKVQNMQHKREAYDQDLIYVQPNNTSKSKFDYLFNTNAAITGNAQEIVAEYIYKPNVLITPEATQLRETLDALKVLEKVPTARLERLLTEHLDCCNYRLDSWKTAVVNEKLQQQRSLNTNKNGLYLGAYGWLLNVRPSDKVQTPVQLSPELDQIFNPKHNTTITTDSANLGYIHAPSINQAATAAILRNAYDTNKDAGTGNPFSLQLNSERVRLANNFLEGARNGQSIAALLGYQFERGLHDKYDFGLGEADQYIYPLRKAFPLVADNMKDTKSEDGDSISTVEANNVIDGLKLIKYVSKSAIKTYPFGLSAAYNLPPANTTQAKNIQDEIERITSIHDAIADAVTAEQVFQVVQGNMERASGNAEAFSKGGYPPELEVMNTPVDGITLTHKVVLHFDTAATVGANPTPRATAEPSVNKWLGSMLPDPSQVFCEVGYTTPVTNGTEQITWADLNLQPIDLLYIFDLDTEAAMNELDDRIATYMRYNITLHPFQQLSIQYTKYLGVNKISFFELAALIKDLRKVVVGAANILPADMGLPKDNEAPATLNDVQLATRVSAIKDDVENILQPSLQNLLTNYAFVNTIADAFQTNIGLYINDEKKINDLTSQLKKDLISFIFDTSAGNKTTIINAFKSGIQSIGNSSTIDNLATTYGQALEAYSTSFNKLDEIAENTINAFMQIALYKQGQTGIGFIYQGIEGIYQSIFRKSAVLLARWDDYKTKYDGLMGAFDPLGNAAEQMELLQKAEMSISSKGTFPLPSSVAAFEGIVTTKRSNFDALYNTIANLKTNSQTSVIGFFNTALSATRQIADFDVLFFDLENDDNTLRTEHQNLLFVLDETGNAIINLQANLTKDLKDFNAQITLANATVNNTDKINALQAAAKVILGSNTILLPHFTLPVAKANEFENAYNASDATLQFVKNLENRIFPVEDWISGLARVRPKIHAWENIGILAGAFNATSSSDLVPLQFPFAINDRWLALRFKENEADPFTIDSGKLLYTAHFATTFNKAQAQCGILIDSWTEVIPAVSHTTGVAFHYDQPNSEPPQTMLLLVSPNVNGNWEWNDVVDSLNETLEMAKKRAVEPVHIDSSPYAQFLPTTMMAVTTHWITAAMNLSLNNNILTILENK